MTDSSLSAEDLLSRLQAEELAARRGQLTILLGFAAGVGKTVRMLEEGHRLRREGKDVVVGYFEHHGRQGTIDRLGDLEVVPRTRHDYRNTALEEMDTAAILRRRPDVTLIDELAHTNVPGSAHEKRWQDVETLLDAGITVITTVNVQHIESLNDKIAKLTGVQVRETVPDQIFTAADNVVIVDLAPEALQERLRRGEIYPAERVEQALQNFFRTTNLSVLRELALLQVAEEADKDVAAYRQEARIAEVWGVQERVLVGITPDRSSAILIRRAVRLARRAQGKCFVVFVTPPGGLGALPPEKRDIVDHDLTLARTLEAEVHVISDKDVAKALVLFARENQITQIFLGRSRKSRWQEWLYGSILADVARYAHGIDVHVVADR